MSAFERKADMAPSRMCCYRLSFDAGLLVLDTPRKIITDTALSGVGDGEFGSAPA